MYTLILHYRRLQYGPTFSSRELLVRREVGLKHVAEQSSLLDGIVERHMRMRHGIEPPPGASTACRTL